MGRPYEENVFSGLPAPSLVNKTFTCRYVVIGHFIGVNSTIKLLLLDLV